MASGESVGKFLGGLLLGAAAAYIWHQRARISELENVISDDYDEVTAEDNDIPLDVVPDSHLTADEIRTFDEIVGHTCMGSCCVETTHEAPFWPEGQEPPYHIGPGEDES